MLQHPAVKTFAWFVLFCVGVEMGFRLLSPDLPPVSEAPAGRNETRLRNWPEYVSFPDSSKDLLAYVSNSQAVGTEYADSSKIYPSIIRASLRKSHPHLRMENWSVSGMNAEQLELLTLQAVEREARYLVLAVSLLNFDSKRNYGFGRDRTDLDLLIGKPSFWFELRNTFIGSYIDWDDKFTRTFQLYSQVGRFRITLFDWAAEHLKRRWHRVVMGHVRSRSALKRIDEQAPVNGPDENAEIRKVSNAMSAELWEKSLRMDKEPRLAAVYDHLRHRLAEKNIELIWLWLPAGESQYNKNAIQGQQNILTEFCGRVRIDGWLCEDLTRALPASNFLPSAFSSHLNLQGHANQAKLITPIIQGAIH